MVGFEIPVDFDMVGFQNSPHFDVAGVKTLTG